MTECSEHPGHDNFDKFYMVILGGCGKLDYSSVEITGGINHLRVTRGMSSIQWSKQMSVGVPALDSDHKCLIRIIDLLSGIEDRIEAPRMIGTVLETLAIYGRHHFAREEKVMQTVGFPGTAFHHAEHQGFAKYISTLRDRCTKRGDPETARELLEYLKTWLFHHILIQDMALKPYIREIERAERAAQSAGPALLQL